MGFVLLFWAKDSKKNLVCKGRNVKFFRSLHTNYRIFGVFGVTSAKIVGWIAVKSTVILTKNVQSVPRGV